MKTIRSNFFIICLAIYLFIFNQLSAQPVIQWGKQIGTSFEDFGKSIDVDNDGNIYVTGWTNDSTDENAKGGYDIYLAKFDSSGNQLWHRIFGSIHNEQAEWLVSREDYAVVAGFTDGDLQSKNMGKKDAFVMKVNAEGGQLWITQIGSEMDETLSYVFVDNTGNIYAIGTTAGNVCGNALGKTDVLLMKLDSNGTIIWKRQCGTNEDDTGGGIFVDKKENIFICGSAHGPLWQAGQEKADAFYASYDKNGNQLWYEEFGTSAYETANTILADEEGNIYIGGSTGGDLGGTQAGNGDAFLIKVDANREIVWKKQFGRDLWDGILAMEFDPSTGNILVGGCQNWQLCEGYCRSYDRNGNLMWKREFTVQGEHGGTCGKDIAVDKNGNIYHTGGTGGDLFNRNLGSKDVYIVKMSEKN